MKPKLIYIIIAIVVMLGTFIPTTINSYNKSLQQSETKARYGNINSFLESIPFNKPDFNPQTAHYKISDGFANNSIQFNWYGEDIQAKNLTDRILSEEVTSKSNLSCKVYGSYIHCKSDKIILYLTTEKANLTPRPYEDTTSSFALHIIDLGESTHNEK
jgi:hypothetical protein